MIEKLKKLISDYYSNIIISYITLCILGYIDYKTGYELSFQFFYFLPIFLISSNKNITKSGLLLFVIIIAFVWFFADFYAGREYSTVFYYFWNTLSRFIVFLFFAFFYHSILQKQIKINNLNIDLSKKDKMVKDSIEYAKSIQHAINPSFNKFQNYLPNSFILYKPKDILSGDFFWHHKINDKLFFALVDCTGHGVPGSMLNIIGNILLNRIIKDKQIFSPSEILETLNYKLNDLFSIGDIPIDDGMEISLVLYEPERNQITISQTTQNAIIVKKTLEIIEINFSLFTIGGLLSKIKKIEYHNETHIVEKGDMLLLFTDGYTDQFRYKNQEKFGIQRFYNLIKDNFEKMPSEICKILENATNEWRKTDRQIDDITIIGIKF